VIDLLKIVFRKSSAARFPAVNCGKDKDFYANKCTALDRQIDALVHELYGLTEAEIKLVECAAP